VRDMENNTRARVFISCGQQKDTNEIEVVREIAEKLEKMGFEPYIAVEEQTLKGVKENLFRRLSESEYFIFIDFKRGKDYIDNRMNVLKILGNIEGLSFVIKS